MAAQVHPPRGMRDILPADQARRVRALGTIRDIYRAHGFDEIETPAVEDHARLHAGLGGDNEKLSFSILKRAIRPEALAAAAESGQAEQLADLGLRFDLTVPLSRFYATHRAELPPVFRAIQIGPVWRAERPQKGRYRQFVQADIDIIGEAGILAEIELITATAQALAALGLAGCSIRVNDRRILFGMLESCGFAAEQHDRALITVDKLDKIGTDGVIDELRDLDAAAADRLGELLGRIAPALEEAGIPLSSAAMTSLLHGDESDLSEGVAAGIASLDELGAALEGGLPEGVTLGFDPTLVRGMGYYTGTIFEVAHPGSGSSVGGGGRYDGMIGRFLGQDVPAVGFSIGFERIIDLIDRGADADSDARVLVHDPDVPHAQLARMKRELVDSRYRVRLEKRQKNMKALLARVAEQGFAQVANVRAEMQSADDLEWRPLA